MSQQLSNSTTDRVFGGFDGLTLKVGDGGEELWLDRLVAFLGDLNVTLITTSGEEIEAQVTGTASNDDDAYSLSYLKLDEAFIPIDGTQNIIAFSAIKGIDLP